nr:tail sheath monomer [uncultured Mediterranean phage uvMED]
MAEKIISPGVFTNEIDQSFLPATAGPIGAAIVGPTVKGPILEPTVVSSYSEYVQIFGELIESGSDKFQYLTSHTAQEYLRQGGPLTVVRVGEPSLTKASASIEAGSSTKIFDLEVIGNGPSFNNSSSLDSSGRLTPLTSSVGNDHFSSGSFGGRADNFRFEVSQRNLAKGTFTLVLRQGNDETAKKKVIETFENLSLDPESPNYILKRIGNQTSTIVTEGGQSFIQNTGEFPNKSKNIRVKNLHVKTPNYLKEDGTLDAGAYGDGDDHIPLLGSGSNGGCFAGGDFGMQNASHPFNFYLATDSDTNSQGVTLATSAATLGTGGYKTAINLLKNKDEFDIDMLFIPGILDQNGSNSNTIIGDAISMCEDRGDCFLVYDNTFLTDTVANAKTNTEARNSSFAAAYYPWVQIQDATTGNFRYVPPSVVIAGVYHFNDTIGQPWFAPAGLNRGGIDSAVQAYRKLTQGNRDDLYESNVNPIATFPGQGVTVFGQKTTQKKASALDRVNVRRLLINLKKFVANSSRGLVFEQNTTDLRNQFLNTVQPYMEQVQANQGLNAFRVVMDDSNNTAETIDRNQLVGQIFIQPTRTAEFIVLDFVVQPTGAAFPE